MRSKSIFLRARNRAPCRASKRWFVGGDSRRERNAPKICQRKNRDGNCAKAVARELARGMEQCQPVTKRALVGCNASLGGCVSESFRLGSPVRQEAVYGGS